MKSSLFTSVDLPTGRKSQDLPLNNPVEIAEPSTINLSNVINIEALQRIQDSFAKANDVASIILDMDRRPITVPSNFNEVCQLIKRSTKGRIRCDLSDKARDEKSKGHMGPVYHQCLSCGFVDGSAPIFIGKTQVAEWLIGQVNVMGISKKRIMEYASEIDVDSDAMVAAFEKMPKVSLEKFEHTLDLLFVITGEMSRLGYNTWKMAREIETRIEVESRLKESESRYHELFNSVVEGICIVDENHKIKFGNPALARMFDVKSLKHIINKDVSTFFDKEQFSIIAAQNKKRKQGLSSQYEVKLKNYKGDVYNVLISASPRRDAQGNFRGAIASLIDITELKRLQEFASRAQRLEAAGRIAAQVAHDFNNLLGPLVAYPEIIKAELPEGNTVVPFLNDMEKAAKTMAEINQQLLTLGRRGHFNSEILDLNELLSRALESFRNYKDKVEIITDFSPELLPIEGGPSQLVRVITNIINNAMDSMGEQGALSIKTENYYVDTVPRKKYSIPTGEYVKITIADNGCGITSDVLPFVYDPFFTTKSTDAKRGSGLGLSVVHAVVEDHNGHVDIKSSAGAGTTVFLYFPISRNRSKEQLVSEAKLAGGRERILIVDDDKLQREVILTLVNRLGYHAIAAIGAEEALAHLKEGRFDLLLLDMILSGGRDGTDIYERSLQFNPTQKAIIISGYADKDRIATAENLGLTTFIRKPVTLDILARAIRQELDMKQPVG